MKYFHTKSDQNLVISFQDIEQTNFFRKLWHDKFRKLDSSGGEKKIQVCYLKHENLSLRKRVNIAK